MIPSVTGKRKNRRNCYEKTGETDAVPGPGGLYGIGMTACGSKSKTGTAAPESKQDVTTEGSSAGTAAEKPDKTAEEASLVMLIEEPNVNYYPVFLENIRAKYPEYSITSKTWDQSQVEKTVKRHLPAEKL